MVQLALNTPKTTSNRQHTTSLSLTEFTEDTEGLTDVRRLMSVVRNGAAALRNPQSTNNRQQAILGHRGLDRCQTSDVGGPTSVFWLQTSDIWTRILFYCLSFVAC